MAQLWSNAARTELAEAITAEGTMLVLKEQGGFPTISGSDWFKVVLQDSAGIEIVRVTAYDGGTQMTVERGEEGTTPRAFAAGSVVGLRLTAGDMAAVRDQLGSDAATYAYTDGVLTGVTETLPGGERTTTFTYDDGVLTGAATTYDGRARTTTYHYTDGVLTGTTETES